MHLRHSALRKGLSRAGTALLLVGLAGCATQAPGKLYFVKPNPFPVKPSTPPDAQNGSVFPENTTGSLYGNQRNWEVGDIVTLNVAVNNLAQDNDSGSLAKSTTLNNSVSAFLGVPPAIGSFRGSPFSPSVNLTDKTNFTGTGATAGSNVVTMQLAAVVTAIEPNGVLALSGRSNVNINGNVTGIVVTGYARPQDIGANDTLNSAQLADANVQYVGVGAINSAHHVPWLTGFLSKYSPF